ncbi:MAG: ArdC-like ssDNA-binding domain-containing protein [Ferrimicrobium sp.]
MMINHNSHAELLTKLTDGIMELSDQSSWRQYLKSQALFHNYSFNNTMLIAKQCPSATRVASFNSWRKLGRIVRKGEKAIWIIAPMIYRESADEDASIRGFKYVPVFDLSQTDGEELPSPCAKLSGDDHLRHYEALVKVANGHGFSVEDALLPEEINGLCSHRERTIKIKVDNSPAHRVKTLAHELSHALLHEDESNRQLAELEAESSAYVICQALGIDSRDYSFGYVALWAGDPTKAVMNIKASAERIQRTAAAVLSSIQPSN